MKNNKDILMEAMNSKKQNIKAFKHASAVLKGEKDLILKIKELDKLLKKED